jgi:hypothetical protein
MNDLAADQIVKPTVTVNDYHQWETIAAVAKDNTSVVGRRP